MLEIKLCIEEIDYSSIIDQILPIILDNMSQKKDGSFVAGILSKMKGLSGAALKAAMAVLPDNVKDEMAAAAVNYYKNEIGKIMEGAAEQKGIMLKVGEIEVKA